MSWHKFEEYKPYYQDKVIVLQNDGWLVEEYKPYYQDKVIVLQNDGWLYGPCTWEEVRVGIGLKEVRMWIYASEILDEGFIR